METVKSRSESPFSRSKAKGHLSDTSENGNVEQVKRKKKNRNKGKPQSNGKEIMEESVSTESDCFEEEKATANETEGNADSNNAEHENGINNGDSHENGNGPEEIREMNENTEREALVSSCGNSEEKIINESNGEMKESGVAEEGKSTEAVNSEESTEQCDNSETESGAKKDSLPLPYLIPLPEREVVCESSGETCNGGTGDLANGETSLAQEEAVAECSDVKENSQVSVNGSDGGSHYEEAASLAEDHIQASPDTATKDDNSVSSKITNFLGMWSYGQEQKQESEVSSSKKIEENATLSHPYLSKVSGRRGIKDRLNSSATVFGSKELEVKTPENPGKMSLDDSFRVRTNPPRLQSADLAENPTLRKFKGKRCLNAGEPDGDEEDDDAYLNTIKRRKLDEKNQESGLLGSILWSPFKKKPFETEDQMKLATAESKLSRLLSPFWFWKKTAAGQKGK